MSRDALVVGINAYRHKALNTLEGVPAKDAEAIAQILEKYGKFRVRRLPEYIDKWGDNARRVVAHNAEVTVKGLRTAIQQLFYPQGDHVPETALLYFSGHGLRHTWAGEQIGYLATSDVNPEEELLGFELAWLQKIMKASPIKQQIVWLDCCHSGELLSSSGIFADLTHKSSLTVNESLQDINPDTEGDYDRCLITASRGFELAFQQVDNDHGVLTAALLKGLDPTQRSDKWVTNTTLADFIKQSLSQEVQCPLFLNYGKPIVLTTAVAQKTGDSAEANICPYKGLAYFDLEDAEFFHGRIALTDRLINKINQHNFLAVIGPSGSGKSSVVRAGLLYELKLGQKLSRSDRWQYDYKPFTPSEQPFKKLKQVLGTRLNNLAKVIQKDEHERVVLFIDQFEECFTLCQSDKERQQFFDCLLDTLEQTVGKLCLIIAMRADFLGKCAEYPRLANKIRAKESLELVAPMSEKDLRKAIEEPAKKVGLEVEPLLVDRLIEDVEGYPGSLPLLQFTLTELWKTRKEPYLNSLTLLAYNNLKGIKGALEKVANEVFLSLSKQQQVVAKRIFLELIQPGQETEDTRRRILKHSLVNEQQSEAVLDEVIGKLVDTRLITRTLVDTENPKSPVILDVVHEALIRHWQELKEWLAQYRDAIRTERKLEDEAEEWEKLGKPEDPAHLRQGARLTEAQDYLEKYGELGLLNALAEEFIQVSQQVQKQIDKEKDEQIRTLNKALTESNLREQAMRVQNLLPARPVESLLLAIQTINLNLERLQEDVLSPVLDCLLWAMSYVHEQNRLNGHNAEICAISLSPDGRQFVSASFDGTLQLWDLTGSPTGNPFRASEQDRINAVAFSPNGEQVVSAHIEYDFNSVSQFDEYGPFGITPSVKICLWNLEGKQVREPFQGPKDEINSVAFSQDGRWIVGGCSDSSLWLWSVKDSSVRHQLQGHEAPVNSVTFSSNGQLIISSSRDGTIRLWNLQGQQVGKPFRSGKEDIITTIVASSNGQWIASGDHDGKIHVWNLPKKRLHVSFQAHNASISSIAFSCNNKLIISGGVDKVIHIWDLDGNRICRPLQGHEDVVTSVVSSPINEKLIVSGSGDKTIRIWNLQNLQSNPLCAHQNRVNSVAFSPDSKMIISATDEGMLGLWDLQGNLLVPLLQGHQESITSIAFSPDGNLIVSGSADRTLCLWDRQGKAIGQPFQGHEDVVNSVAFSPDGNLIVSGSADRTLCLWDRQGKAISQPFQGHEDVVNSVAFSPDGNLIVSGGNDGVIQLWNLQGTLVTPPFRGHEGGVTCVAFSPISQFLISGGIDRTLRLWDLEGNKITEPFQGHGGWVSSVSFSRDGKHIISSSYDYSLKLWDLRGSTIGPPFQGHEDVVSSVAVSPDGRWIISGSYDGTLRLWDSSDWSVRLRLAHQRLQNHSLMVSQLQLTNGKMNHRNQLLD
ncbi:MAG: caspase family protein [Stenomitos rutilans HA7619-LM2]|jgi:WD40 repeat protein/ABC-type oligopeptide transport system ATPase subunit|nr:caspase family protein [Stenomitos rutilans HA7619-LM2]